MINLKQGDCLELLKEIPDKSIDLVVIDPPYKYCTGGKHTGMFRERKTRYHDELENANLTNNFDLKILDELDRVMKRTNIYIWCNKEQIYQYMEHYKKEKFEIIIWHKTNPIPTVNNKYLSDKEYCLYFKKSGVLLNGSVSTKSTVYSTPLNTKDKRKWQHPTIKPLNIIENLIINSSNENDVVLDCFMGSGTTGVACKKLNRNFIGMEIDKKYFDTAKERIDETKLKGE